jgi:Protease inhibitor Inh
MRLKFCTGVYISDACLCDIQIWFTIIVGIIAQLSAHIRGIGLVIARGLGDLRMINTRLARTFLFAVMAAFALAGCNRSFNTLETRAPPQPLPSAPLEPVQTSQLNPASPDSQVPSPIAGQIDSNDQYASLDGASSAPQTLEPQSQESAMAAPSGQNGPTLSREEMAGTWTVASDNPDCRIILAFTKWSGGYRAATRRCNSTELGAVTAWDVKGQSVVLVDSNGSTVASLYSSGPERYDGSLAGGTAISFSR